MHLPTLQLPPARHRLLCVWQPAEGEEFSQQPGIGFKDLCIPSFGIPAQAGTVKPVYQGSRGPDQQKEVKSILMS